jgi:hypothetical protein
MTDLTITYPLPQSVKMGHKLIAIGYINPAQIHIILPEVNVIIEHFSNV